MEYVIMNRNAVEGILRGRVGTINNTFFQCTREERLIWTPYIVDAMVFNTEVEAWTYIYHLSGFDNSNENYWVVSVNERSKSFSEHTKEIHQGEFIKDPGVEPKTPPRTRPDVWESPRKTLLPGRSYKFWVKSPAGVAGFATAKQYDGVRLVSVDHMMLVSNDKAERIFTAHEEATTVVIVVTIKEGTLECTFGKNVWFGRHLDFSSN